MTRYTVSFSRNVPDSRVVYTEQRPAETLSEACGIAAGLSTLHGHANIIDDTGNVTTYVNGTLSSVNGNSVIGKTAGQ